MQYLIFIFYLLVFAFTICKIPFLFKQTGKTTIVVLFVVKVLAGIAYAKFYSLPKYYTGSDTWRFYRLSLPETKWLLADPTAFIKDLFVFGYQSSGNIFSGDNSYWNDLKSNVLVKIMAVVNVFTASGYYANILFFNFFFLFGLVGIFRLLYARYPLKKFWIIASVFLLPSTLFWCSGIHKDGLILSAAGLSFYLIDKQLKAGVTLKKMFALAACMLIIFALRNYVAFALAPALLTYGLVNKFASKQNLIFAAVYLSGAVLFFCASLINPALDFPAFVVAKRNEFFLLEANSGVAAIPLLPTVKSFVAFIPYALDMAVLQPHVTGIKNLAYLPAAFEIVALFVLVLAAVIFFNSKRLTGNVSLLLFGISILLVCGYTVPFVGAVVRYRSIALPFIFGPLLCMVDFATIAGKAKTMWRKLL